MALVGQHDRVGVEITGSRTSVPSDPTSRLQYYLSCIVSLLPGLDIPSRLYDYQSAVLNSNEQDVLLQITDALSPSHLDGKIIFENNDLECGNEFVKLSLNRTSITAVRSIVIAGKQERVTEIMMYTRNWMSRNYHSARREIRSSRSSTRSRRSSCSPLSTETRL